MSEEEQGNGITPTVIDSALKNKNLSDSSSPIHNTYLKITSAAIKKHYNRDSVKETLIKCADYNGSSRIAVFDNNKIYDPKPNNKNCVLFFSDKTKAQSQVKLFQGNDPRQYTKFIKIMDRTYYLTLNYLPRTHRRFQEYYPYGENSRDRIDDFDECVAFKWSVDIDLVEPHNIDNEEDQEMLLKAVQHAYETFNEASNCHVLILCSGGGAYLQLHPAFGVVDPSVIGEERIKQYKNTMECFNSMIEELERTFEIKYPEYAPYKGKDGNDKKRVKFDRINNINRQIKAPMSLHRTKPYAVLPIITGEWKLPLTPFQDLTDDELMRYKDIIFDFFDNKPTDKDLTKFEDYITQWKTAEHHYESEFDDQWKEISEDGYPAPDPRYELETILQEPITKALCSDKPWNDGNVRRNRIIASILKACGWILEESRDYLYQRNVKWNTNYDDLDRIIERGYNMYPPNFDRIYKTIGNFSRPGLQDVLKSNPEYLPEMPTDYENPVQHIHHIFNENKKIVEKEQLNLKLIYPTNHLLGFEDLDNATELSGEEYTIIKKGLWYTLLSYQIKESKLNTGNVKPDCRVNLLIPVKTGHGKGNIKRVIKRFVKIMGGVCGEPTSLYPEQLIGKIVKIDKELQEKRGYLSDDYFIVDEAHTLMKSSDLRYTESRSYLRTALDPYPYKNTIHKRMTEFGKDKYLEYNPYCPATIFLQPFRMEDDILVTEGDVRRYLIPYVNLTGVNKNEAYKNRLLKIETPGSLNNFIVTIKNLLIHNEFKMPYTVRVRFLELFHDLMDRGMNYNDKIRNFTDTVGFTLQDHLMTLSAIQAFQHSRSSIEVEDVELAYIDLFEFMEHEYQYVNDKIPGMLDYGEKWLGATDHDQKMLKWLYDQGATNLENSKISIKKYQERIMDIFMVKDREARRISRKHRDNGWIQTKQGQHQSLVWLGFNPDESSERSGWTSDIRIPRKSGSLEEQFEYYKLIKKYDNIGLNLPVTAPSNLPALCPKSIMTTIKI